MFNNKEADLSLVKDTMKEAFGVEHRPENDFFIEVLTALITGPNYEAEEPKPRTQKSRKEQAALQRSIQPYTQRSAKGVPSLRTMFRADGRKD